MAGREEPEHQVPGGSAAGSPPSPTWPAGLSQQRPRDGPGDPANGGWNKSKTEVPAGLKLEENGI